MEEISSNSDILRYISGDGDQDDITEDSFIVVDRQTEPDHRSPEDQEAMEKSKLEQMMASVSMKTSGCPEASTSKQACCEGGDHTPCHSSNQSSEMYRSVDIEETTRLKDTVKLLEAKLRSNNQVVRNALDQLQAANELKSKNEELQHRVNELEVKIDDLVLSPTASHDELIAVKKQLDASNKDVEDLKKKIAEIEELYQLQVVQNAEIEELYKLQVEQNNELKEKIRNTTNGVSQSQSKDMETSSELLTLNAVVSSLDLAMEMMKKKLEDAELALEGANKTIALRDEEIMGLKESMDQATVKATKFREDVTEKISHLTEQGTETDNKLREALVEKQLYQDKCGQLGRQIKELLEEMDQARQVPHNSDNHMELERLRQQIAIMDRENTELRTQIAALTTEQEHSNHWKEQCEVYRTDYEQVVAVKDQLNTRVLELSQELENMHDQMDLMTRDLSEAQLQRARLAQQYVERTERSPTTSDTEARSRSGPESLKSVVENAFTSVTSEVGKLLRPQPWTSSRPAPSDTESNASSANAPPPSPTEEGAAGGSRSDPCPLCLKSFPSVAQLVEHSSTCGELAEPYGSHMEPFVVVPNQ